MWTVAHILVGAAPMLLAAADAFIQICGGSSGARAFLRCWGLIVVWFAVFTLLFPLILGAFDRHAARVVCDWVAEPPIIIGMLFFGWFYAGIIVLLAVLARWVRSRFVRRAQDGP